MPARKQPPRGKPWTPEIVRQRIRVSMIVNRLEKQALGLLDGYQVYKRPMIRRGKWAKDRQGKPKYEQVVRFNGMTPTQLVAATALLDRCLPKAQAPLDVSLQGNISVVVRDPTARPEGYHRKGRKTP